MKHKCLKSSVVLRAQRLRVKPRQYRTGTFHFLLLLFFNCCSHREQECLRLFHRCANLVSIAVLVENSALKDFTQKCLNLSELCLNLDIVQCFFFVTLLNYWCVIFLLI